MVLAVNIALKRVIDAAIGEFVGGMGACGKGKQGGGEEDFVPG